jgi:ArsR family transcriptional regulator, arsenate/arsenite/antimonite-responsive transcriptional repressor
MSTQGTPALDPLAFARALADDTRQKLMQHVCCEWRSVGELAELLGVSQPTVSHHLAILRDAGLVRVRPEGRQTFYTLNQDQVAACCGRLMVRYAPEVALPSSPSGGEAG